MISNDKILEEADYYIENDISMKEVGEHFNVSKKTIQVHLNDKLLELDEARFKLVQEKKQKRLIMGAKKGGQTSSPKKTSNISSNRKGKYKIPDEKIEQIARSIINGDLSLRDIESMTKIPKSTISDNLTEARLGKEIYEKLSETLKTHKEIKGKNK